MNWNKPLISEEDPGIAYGQKLYEKRPGRMEGHCSLKAKQSKNKQKQLSEASKGKQCHDSFYSIMTKNLKSCI